MTTREIIACVCGAFLLTQMAVADDEQVHHIMGRIDGQINNGKDCTVYYVNYAVHDKPHGTQLDVVGNNSMFTTFLVVFWGCDEIHGNLKDAETIRKRVKCLSTLSFYKFESIPLWKDKQFLLTGEVEPWHMLPIGDEKNPIRVLDTAKEVSKYAAWRRSKIVRPNGLYIAAETTLQAGDIVFVPVRNFIDGVIDFRLQSEENQTSKH